MLGRVRRARVVGSALVVALGAIWLSGCDSDAAAPPPMETSTRSPSATPSPTPTAPTLPAEAKGTTEASAEAFVRHYIDVLNYAGRSGDTAALSALSADTCESCLNIISRIDNVYAAGGSIEGDGWAVFEINAVRGQPLRLPILEVGVNLSPQVLRADATAQPEEFEGGRQAMTFRLQTVDGTWMVQRLDKVE